jgi:hypothetical protein
MDVTATVSNVLSMTLILTWAHNGAIPLFHTRISGALLYRQCSCRSGVVSVHSADTQGLFFRHYQCPNTQINSEASYAHTARMPSSEVQVVELKFEK